MRRRSRPARAYVAVKRPLLDDLAPVHLPHARLRQDVDEDRHRHPGQRLRPRRARGPDAPRAALRRHAARRLHLVRRRRPVAALVAQPARRAGLGPHRRGQRDRDRDARPRLLRARRHRAAAAVTPASSDRADVVPVQAGAEPIRGAGGATITLLAASKPAREADDRDPRRARARSYRRFKGAPPAGRGGRGRGEACGRGSCGGRGA